MKRPPSPSPESRTQVEMPTLVLAVAIYGAWLALTWWHAAIPPWLLAVAGGWIIAWHGSLQHETIHGHPTRHAWLNALIGGAPLSLWLPYAVYRRTHVAHHRTPAITDPFDDPESRYLSGQTGRIGRLIGRLEAPLLGRLLLGPVFTVGRFLADEVRRTVRRPGAVARDWLPHLVAVAAVLAWLSACGFGIGGYVLLFVYPGIMLTLLRSFAEHRAAPLSGHRVALVEDRGPLALLYLNNNLHAAHHAAPALPWYDLRAYHAANRPALIAENGGLVYRSYAEVAARFLWRPHDRLIHPDHI